MAVLELDPIKLNRLLRRDAVDRAVLVLTGATLVAAGLAIFFGVLQSVRAVMEGNTARLALENEIAKIGAGSQALPQEQRDNQDEDYSIIWRKPFFGELGTKAPPIAAPTPKPVSNTALTLIGTFITPGEEPWAIIEDQKKNTQEVFNLKDSNSVFGEATLKAIYSDRVEIERNGQLETLALDETGTAAPSYKEGVATVGEDTFYIEEAELDKAMENLPLLLTQARAVPYFQDGKSVGLRLFAIRSGSLFEKIGLLNGDILKSINGNSLADFSQAMTLFQKLKEERNISISLERNKVEKEFKYNIK